MFKIADSFLKLDGKAKSNNNHNMKTQSKLFTIILIIESMLFSGGYSCYASCGSTPVPAGEWHRIDCSPMPPWMCDLRRDAPFCAMAPMALGCRNSDEQVPTGWRDNGPAGQDEYYGYVDDVEVDPGCGLADIMTARNFQLASGTP